MVKGMANVLKKDLNRFQLLAVFVLFSVVLFLIIRFIAGMIYYNNVTNDIIGQFTGAVDVATKTIGIYLLILFLMATVGLSLSKTKGKLEYVRGFKLSLIFCGILFVIFVLFMLSTQ
jgi:uncharacterized membrane protein YhdT